MTLEQAQLGIMEPVGSQPNFKQPSFYLQTSKKGLSSEQQFTSENRTLYLPRIKELAANSSQGFENQESENRQMNTSQSTFMMNTFDSLFYKRLQHIERVLDEDPMELEKFKNYYQQVVKRGGDN